jgi:hypothetical protein
MRDTMASPPGLFNAVHSRNIIDWRLVGAAAVVGM